MTFERILIGVCGAIMMVLTGDARSMRILLNPCFYSRMEVKLSVEDLRMDRCKSSWKMVKAAQIQSFRVCCGYDKFSNLFSSCIITLGCRLHFDAASTYRIRHWRFGKYRFYPKAVPTASPPVNQEIKPRIGDLHPQIRANSTVEVLSIPFRGYPTRPSQSCSHSDTLSLNLE